MSVSVGRDAHQWIELCYPARFGLSSKEVLVQEGFSSSTVISRQEGSPHHINPDSKSPPSLCSAQTSPFPCSQGRAHPSQGTAPSSPRTAHCFGKGGQNDSHQPENILFFPYSFLLKEGIKAMFLFSVEKRSAKHCWRRIPSGFQRKSLPIYLTVNYSGLGSSG